MSSSGNGSRKRRFPQSDLEDTHSPTPSELNLLDGESEPQRSQSRNSPNPPPNKKKTALSNVQSNLKHSHSPSPGPSGKKGTGPPRTAPKTTEDDKDGMFAPSLPIIYNFKVTSDDQLEGVSRGPVFLPISERDTSDFRITADIPMNRQGFRYIPAGPSPIPGIICRTLESPPASCVHVSWEDRSPFVRVTEDGLRMTTDKGYRSARLNVPIREGKWYFEVVIERGGGEGKGDVTNPEGSHVRLGWGRREAPLNGPVGLDGYSYGMRDKTGEKVTLSRPKPYGRPFHSGDVIGLYISLPSRTEAQPGDPTDPARIVRKRIPIQFKHQLYFESMEYRVSKEMEALLEQNNKPPAPTLPSPTKRSAKSLPERNRPKPVAVPVMRPLPILKGSKIAFFVNGECQGVAFEDIYDYLQLRADPKSSSAKGSRKGGAVEAFQRERENVFDDGWLGYYPFISVFGGGTARINAGPDFHFPPPDDIDALLELGATTTSVKQENSASTWRSLQERYAEFMAEQWALDAKEEAHAKAAIEANNAENARRAEAARKRRENDQRKREALKAERGTATPPVDHTPGTTTPQNLEPDVPPDGLSHLGTDGAYVYQVVDASAAWDALADIDKVQNEGLDVKREFTPMEWKQE
ncbi:Set1 complex component ash2 [Ceratobasidium theobromae]|uniref:Set1 complex component ash2 n=1 Tax=Ceratobasidium theobromae TaxID=1582974 RepID=A0A5N5QR46_9AGAM|nr:Set1 complex component ash2 [Ceratobasidium theobromae]